MRLGIWCPAPLSIRPDARVKPALDALTQHGGGVDRNFLYARDVVRRAEQLGFDITLIAQRFLGPDIDSWMMGTALATQTSTIEIMAAVHPGIIDPRVIAKHAASIDRISGGRFCVNIVNGTRPWEFDAFGQWLEIAEPRYRRMDEFIRVMKGLWTNDAFTFKGEFYSFENCSVPTKSVRAPHPPVYAASRVEDGMEVVARECDYWFVNPINDYTRYDESLKKLDQEIGVMNARCAALGRKMHYGISVCLLLADTDAEANDIAAGYVEQFKHDPSLKSAANGLSAGIIGSRRTIVERMQRYVDMGVELFMMQFYPMQQGLEVFAQEILPDLPIRAPLAAQ